MNPTRRDFVKTIGKTSAAVTLAIRSVSAEKNPSIQDVIDTVIKNMTDAPLAQTVDVVKQGDPSQKVTGITTTFLATFDILKQAVNNGDNFIISHEPIFYEHLDKTEWLQDHSVYQAKRDYIDEHNLVIWRCHDYIHAMQPDGIIAGVTQKIGWENYVDPQHATLFHLPETTVGDVVSHIKKTFNVPAVRLVGDPEMACSKIGLMVGAPGGIAQMNATRDLEPDVLICGEIAEWMTNIYYQDACTLGQNKALIVMGHEPSEEAGMAWMAEWLNALMPNVRIRHCASGLGYKVV